MRVAISGKQGSGKTTLANEFVKEYGFESLSFAKAVKEVAMKEYGLSYEEAFGAQKDRAKLQEIGQSRREMFGTDYWVKKTLSGLDENKNYVLDDLRYRSEFDALKDLGFILIRVEASEPCRRERIPEIFGNPEHISEIDLDDIYLPTYKNHVPLEKKKYVWDVWIYNELIELTRFKSCIHKIYRAFIKPQDN